MPKNDEQHAYSHWSNTAIEHAVFCALGLHGYENQPGCGYSRHPNMVPQPGLPAVPDNEAFVDFTVLTDDVLFNEYVIKTLAEKGFAAGYVDGAKVPTATLTHPGKNLQLCYASDDNPARALCVAILVWFDVKSVPEWVHRFDSDLADHDAESERAARRG